ncbi:hypothetical protein K470DRAFT_220492 [Piedraia hortae CBS 480.64]|uniref:U three protein 23 n=1 Tax=Piedraia hortae CBS 480.64 TaxID=1314780 RepID=A0A6A7BVN0_9PEZI|nr:hypothetical protein K470DRAFT_220492 [Piedraia hortae CBS 480.64]
MRAKRSKQYRKLMQQYSLTFGFREPYQVLLDAEIIQSAARFKMNLGASLSSTLQAKEIKPMITQCCIRHLYNHTTETPAEKSEKDAWIATAKQAERRRCGHHELEEPLSTQECLLSFIDPKKTGKNKHRYIVATQDQQLRARLRQIAGVPLIYINRSIMLLEPMAATTAAVRDEEETSKLRSGLKSVRPAGTKRKRDDADERTSEGAKEVVAAEAKAKKRKVRGPKGPNPLSMKKAKKQAGGPKTPDGAVGNTKRKERQRNRRRAKEEQPPSTTAVAVITES